MSGIIDKRKRSREDDILCESTPLSKRINNLHLSNFEEAHNYSQHLLSNGHPNNNTNQDLLAKDMIATSVVNVSTLKSMSVYEPDKSLYEPELNESQNPFYYFKNKLLHDLHLERLKRCSV